MAGEKDDGRAKSSVLKIYSDHVARHLAEIREAGIHAEGVFTVWTYRITNDNRGASGQRAHEKCTLWQRGVTNIPWGTRRMGVKLMVGEIGHAGYPVIVPGVNGSRLFTCCTTVSVTHLMIVPEEALQTDRGSHMYGNTVVSTRPRRAFEIIQVPVST